MTGQTGFNVDGARVVVVGAARSGVATSALRFYEDQGLITAERTDSGHRRYPRSVLRRVAFIVFAQKVGLSLDEIGGELGPPASTVHAVLVRCRIKRRSHVDWITAEPIRR